MLSYRHAFHAGNFADVLKHTVLVQILKHLLLKDKPFVYIDTHAGAGGYSLTSPQADKNREFESGIGRLWSRRDLPPALQDYVQLVQLFNHGGGLRAYPGSPWFAAHMLRSSDRMQLFELHPSDHAQLARDFATRPATRIAQADGYKACIALLPPSERRGMVLLDPSYEIKADYQNAVDTLVQAHRRFQTGTYALWYPVVERQRIKRMAKSLHDSGIADILQIELAVRPDNPGRGMSASGLFIINPPWTLAQTLKETLPYLEGILAEMNLRRSIIQQINP